MMQVGHIKLNPGSPFNRKKTLLNSKLYLILRMKLVKSCICSTALYGAQTSESRSEYLQKFGYGVLEKMLECSREK